MDEKKAEKELQKIEYEEFKENAELKAIIAGQKAKKKSIKINDIEIQIRAAIPKGQRDRLVRIAKSYQNDDMDEGDEEMYDVIAEMCLDAPYNKPEAWKFVDEETGEAPNVLMMIVEEITKTEAIAKTFRK